MCDTVVASPSSTREHVMLFGKNSDRQRNEAQRVELVPGADHARGSAVACTYISIPQAPRTHAVMLCRPFWIWGAEMGANEEGVVIGNEGVHARSPSPAEPALIGMDLVRLGLERGGSASEALETITQLLERHGQGGNCGHIVPSFYNNSFIIADATEAFVLETVRREWLVERVHDVRAISNDYSIGGSVERTSRGVPALLRSFGWQEGAVRDHAAIIGNPESTHIRAALERRTRAASLLRADEGRLATAHIMGVLRDHNEADAAGETWRPGRSTRYGPCIHAAPEPRNGQTTGSMVSELRQGRGVHWVTGTAAPCISIFKPLLLDAPMPEHGPPPTDRFDLRSLWWRHEQLHRTAVCGDFRGLLEEIRGERDALEESFRNRIAAVCNGGGEQQRAATVAQCWNEALQAEERWRERVRVPTQFADTPHVQGWKTMNELAGFEGAANLRG
jgi:secernin